MGSFWSVVRHLTSSPVQSKVVVTTFSRVGFGGHIRLHQRKHQTGRASLGWSSAIDPAVHPFALVRPVPARPVPARPVPARAVPARPVPARAALSPPVAVCPVAVRLVAVCPVTRIRICPYSAQTPPKPCPVSNRLGSCCDLTGGEAATTTKSIHERPERGPLSWNAGFWSRRVRPCGLTMPPFAMHTARAVSSRPVPSLWSATNVVAQHVSLIWSMVGVLVTVVSAARSLGWWG
jgi:hypothetical protein